MTQITCIRRCRLFSLLAVILAFFSAGISAQDTPEAIPSISPGAYSIPQVLTFTKPQNCRLLINLDDTGFVAHSAPIILTVRNGEEKEFVVNAELYSLSPDSPVLWKKRFIWRIDRKAPSAPVFGSQRVKGGYQVTMTLNEPGIVRYQMYHPVYASYASDSVPSGTSVFLPEGASLCAYGTDSAGNSGPAASPGSLYGLDEPLPFRILNPVPGTWANAQVLLVDSAPGTLVSYSLDDSDPTVSGSVYDGPVVLDTIGLTHLKIAAVDITGKKYFGEVYYTVEKLTGKSFPGFSLDTPLVDTGEFAEVHIPKDFAWSFDDRSVTGASLPDGTTSNGGSQLLFSAVRDTVRYYPVTVSDGTSSWRLVFKSGTNTSVATADSSSLTNSSGISDADNSSPTIHMLDWNFISIGDTTSPVYYSFDRTSWIRYTEPIFVDRSVDTIFYWYADGYANGKTQIVTLPAKPIISGIPLEGISAAPVVLSLNTNATSYTFYYEIGSAFLPLLPDRSSPVFSNALLFDVPNGASAPFSVRILAVYNNLVQGELDTSFVVDRKPPRKPSSGLKKNNLYSRIPVTLSPSGEGSLDVAINPPLFSQKKDTWILEGKDSGPVTYTIRLTASDRAGNVSEATIQSVTVDLNAIYVDAASSSDQSGDGTPSAPYNNLDDAFDAIQSPGKWRLYLKSGGSIALHKRHRLTADIDVHATDAEIVVFPDAGMDIVSDTVSFTGGYLHSSANISDTATTSSNNSSSHNISGFPVLNDAVFTVKNNGRLELSKVNMNFSGALSVSLISVSGSSVICKNSTFSLATSEYAVLLDAENSFAEIADSTFSGTSDTVSCLSLLSSRLVLSSSSFNIEPKTAGRAIASWNSQLRLHDVAFERNGTTIENDDTALWFDKKTIVLSESGITVKGFQNERNSTNVLQKGAH